MKQITLIFGDGYDDVVSVTAIGRSGMVTNICTRADKIFNGEILYYPEEIKLPQIKLSQSKTEE